MPTSHRARGFEFRIYTDDHPPAHVHAWHGEGEVIVFLGDDENAPSVREVSGSMRSRDVVRAVKIVERHQKRFLREWRKIYG